MNRNLSTVVRDIISVVPTCELELHASLASLKSSVDYAAPEAMGMWWQLAFELLYRNIFEKWNAFQSDADLAKHLRENHLEWQEKVREIWMGECA